MASERPPWLRRAATFVVVTGIGVGAYVWLTQAGQEEKKRPRRDQGQPVRVLEVAQYAAVPRVTGYGAVAAQRSWQGVAEAGGRVVEIDERLQVGRIVRAGTVLLKIDPEDLELERNRSVASVKGVRAQIAELRVRETSAKSSLAVENKVLELARKELQRTRGLHADGALSLSEVETAEKAVLASEKTVVALQNTLAELPANRRVLEAQLDEVQAGVTGAERGLSRAELVAPFTMRISTVSATVGQAVSSGQVVVVGDGVDVVEVTARLPVGAIDPLLPTREPRPESPTDVAAAGDPPDSAGEPAPDPQPAPDPDPAALPEADPAAPRVGGGRFARIAETVSARVRLESQAVSASWPAQFARFSGIDPATRTLGVVVSVDRAQRRAASQDVQLSPGLHVAVDFTGAPKPGCLAIPAEAVHTGFVHVVGPKDRLEIRAIEIAWGQEEFVCVATGLQPGDRVALSELTPAVEGMLLAPTVDAREAARMAELTAAEPPAP